MAFMRGHFYIWSGGEYVSFTHGAHTFEGEPIDDQCGPDGSVEDNTLCGAPADRDHAETLILPTYIVEEFVAMYWARMTDDERKEANERVGMKYGGSEFGADGVMQAAGLPTVMDVVMENVERLEGGDDV